MKKEDLLEFLRSIIEEDAIISRIFNLFHLTYDYSLDTLDMIIQYGLTHNYFTLEDINDSNKKYEQVDWRKDNNYQELIMINKEKFISELFSNESHVPKEFIQFEKEN